MTLLFTLTFFVFKHKFININNLTILNVCVAFTSDAIYHRTVRKLQTRLTTATLCVVCEMYRAIDAEWYPLTYANDTRHQYNSKVRPKILVCIFLTLLRVLVIIDDFLVHMDAFGGWETDSHF